jgi:hypothetical protein
VFHGPLVVPFQQGHQIVGLCLLGALVDQPLRLGAGGIDIAHGELQRGDQVPQPPVLRMRGQVRTCMSKRRLEAGRDEANVDHHRNHLGRRVAALPGRCQVLLRADEVTGRPGLHPALKELGRRHLQQRITAVFGRPGRGRGGAAGEKREQRDSESTQFLGHRPGHFLACWAFSIWTAQ